MGLLDRLLDNAHVSGAGPRKAIFRVLLDDEGRVQDVVLKQSSGNPEIDRQGRSKFMTMRFPPGRLGPTSKKARRWHEFAYSGEGGE
ncbi:energy transducer TonB [Paraburkholderia sp. Se-20369]|nr:energy transducer TonB [Paraburkholderia sp. Se-20369]